MSKVYGLLGLARRAGAIVSGTDRVRRALREGDARLVLLAGDASEAQLEKVFKILRKGTIPRARLGDRESLGAALGLAPISAAAVTSASLADKVLTELGSAAAAGAVVGED